MKRKYRKPGKNTIIISSKNELKQLEHLVEDEKRELEEEDVTVEQDEEEGSLKRKINLTDMIGYNAKISGVIAAIKTGIIKSKGWITCRTIRDSL